MDLFGRMTVLRIDSGDLIIHDPCKIESPVKNELNAIGRVKYIVAPGNYHHLFVTDFQAHYPEAETFICPGLERKRPDIPFDWILGNRPDHRWEGILDLVLIQGTKYIWEVAIFHKPSKTLILVDLIENIGDDYRHKAGLLLRLWWKVVYRMWGNPKPAPEYQMGWGKKELVREALGKIIGWKAQRVILSHGELIEGNVSEVLGKAWCKVLESR